LLTALLFPENRLHDLLKSLLAHLLRGAATIEAVVDGMRLSLLTGFLCASGVFCERI